MRLLASDLDGTLLQTHARCSTENQQALVRAQAEGLGVVFVTGRPTRWVTDIPQITGFTGPALCANGAVMVDLASQEIAWADVLEPDLGYRAVELLREIDPGMAFAVELAAVENEFMIDDKYVPRWETFSEPIRADVHDMLATGLAVKLLGRPTPQFSDSADRMLTQVQVALDGLVEVTHSDLNDLLLEISSPGVHKGGGLAKYAAQIGVSQQEIAAVGDMPNDIPMISWAARGAAVANAHEWVKAVADEHLPSNDENGVAVFIDRILSGN